MATTENPKIKDIPEGTPLKLDFKNGIAIPLNICKTEKPDHYTGSDVTFNHGDFGVYKIYVDGVLVVAFRV